MEIGELKVKKLRFEGQLHRTDCGEKPKDNELKSFHDIEGEDTIEKRLRVFRARSLVVFLP